ncbi:MAG: alpha/beta fold hydrolase [Aquaticitalea sp.]
MPFITHQKSKQHIDLYYQDYGTGTPVILIHGWPLSHRAWESQVAEIVDAGFRCITYDRRGFGVSSAPWQSYDYSALATDLNEIITQLKLKDAIIVGFSMGGGEVVRYFTDFGDKNIKKAVLISSIIPLVKKKPDNPDGVPEKDLKDIMESLKADRVGFLKEFHKNFYNYDKNKEKVSESQLHYDWTIASHASPHATIEAAKAWAETDFRSELKNVTVPTLIVHGDADNIVPIKTAGDQAAMGIENNTYKVIKGGPHGLNVTHTEQLNEILIEFLKS